MSAVVLDSGALIALERNERRIWTLVRELSRRSTDIMVPTTVVAQCFRKTSRQARLHAALDMCTIMGFDLLARRVGELLGKSKTEDICDAHVAFVGAMYADAIYTSDPDDIQHLIEHCGLGTPLVVRV